MTRYCPTHPTIEMYRVPGYDFGGWKCPACERDRTVRTGVGT